MRIIIVLYFVIWTLSFAHSVHAQSTFSSVTNADISLTPAYPSPSQSVRATLGAYGYDTTSASIYWFIDGVEQENSRNKREFTFTSSALGTTQSVTARIDFPDGRTLSVEKTIRPVRLDIIIEGDTLVPVQYHGRALPSVGSTVRMVALLSTGTALNTNELSYNWQINNKSLYGGPVLGRNVATAIVPMGQTFEVSVGIANKTGDVLARKAIIVNSVEPEIIFYENNPLRGVSQNALRSPYQLIADEITVQAEPYYMSKNIFAQNPLLEWTVSGQKIQNPSTDPKNITLRKSGTNGRYDVEFHIRNLTQLLQGVRDSFTVIF